MRNAWVALTYLTVCSVVFLPGTQVTAEVFRETFDDNQIDPAIWTMHVYGTGPQISPVNQQLEISIPGSSSGRDFGAKLSSNFRLRGDFDIQVDFRLLVWPYGNGVRTALGRDSGFLYPPGLERISFGQNDYPGAPRESYLTDFDGGVCGITETSDITGTLRLVRTGSSQTGYYYHPSGQWVAVCTDSAPTDDMTIQLSAFTAYQFMGWDVLMAFDNFVVNSGELVDFPVPTLVTSWGAVKALYR